MGRKPFWRRIDLEGLVVGLWFLIGLLAWWYRPGIWWSLGALPAYMRGDLGTSADVELVEHAAEVMGHAPATPPPAWARELLERALAIDPHSRAHLGLAEWYRRAGQPDRAADHYRRYLAIDPWEVEAYVFLSQQARQQGRWAEAEGILRTGADAFASAMAAWRPCPDPNAPPQANAKSEYVHRFLEQACARLQAELASWSKAASGAMVAGPLGKSGTGPGGGGQGE